MSDIAALHRAALAATRPRIVNVSSDQWTAPSVCDTWDVRALVNHVISGNLWAAELVAGRTIAEVGDRFDGDVAGTDPVAAYDESADLAAAAFEAPGALEAPCAVSYGPVPGSLYAGHRFVDVLIHGWDIAATTGQYRELDPELVDACWEVITPQIDLLKASGMFGGEITPPAGADSQTRLLALLGRVA